jgi:hypothetical protein
MKPELQDSAARAAALDPRRSFIVQAPAGSGKTELLVRRYIELLTTVQQPEEPVAITFTIKAAAKMRQRVLEKIDAPDNAPRLNAHTVPAFFAGLMQALPGTYGEIDKLLSFDDAKANFLAAARHGLGAQLTWIGGEVHTAPGLILGHLLPLAREGLKASKVDGSDIDLYLGTIEERARTL